MQEPANIILQEIPKPEDICLLANSEICIKIKFFKIINQDKRDFVFEYEFVSIFDFIKLIYISIIYPFKTLRLLQKKDNKYNKLFFIILEFN